MGAGGCNSLLFIFLFLLFFFFCFFCLFSSSFHPLCSTPSLHRCLAVVAIFHAGCVCDLCVSRNESAGRLPPSRPSPLRSGGPVCRYRRKALTRTFRSKDATEAMSEAEAKLRQTCVASIRRCCKGGERVEVAGVPPTLRGAGGRADRDRRPALRHQQPAGRPGQTCEAKTSTRRMRLPCL